MNKVLDPLKKIEPLLQHIKLDKKKAESFPDLLLVLKNHTQSTDFMIQFFKKPLVENCNCKACNESVFKPVRMPQPVYDKVKQYPMPMPIPKPPVVGDTSAPTEAPTATHTTATRARSNKRTTTRYMHVLHASMLIYILHRILLHPYS